MEILAGGCRFRLRRVVAHLCVVGVGCALVGTVAPVAASDVPVLDDSWGVDGEVDSPFGDSPVRLVAGASGSLYVVEAEVDSGPVRVARLLSDGSLDTGFDSDGIVAIGGSGDWTVVGAERTPSGGVMVLGSDQPSGPTRDAWLISVEDDGSLDSGFGTSGVVDLGFVTTSSPTCLPTFTGVSVDSSGEVLVSATYAQVNWADYSTCVNIRKGVLLNLSASGSVDTSFGSSGSVAGRFLAVEASASGKVLAVIEGQGVFRYSSTGAVDSSFDPDFAALFDYSRSIVEIDSVNDVVLVGGRSLDGDGSLLGDVVVPDELGAPVVDSSGLVYGFDVVGSVQRFEGSGSGVVADSTFGYASEMYVPAVSAVAVDSLDRAVAAFGDDDVTLGLLSLDAGAGVVSCSTPRPNHTDVYGQTVASLAEGPAVHFRFDEAAPSNVFVDAMGHAAAWSSDGAMAGATGPTSGGGAVEMDGSDPSLVFLTGGLEPSGGCTHFAEYSVEMFIRTEDDSSTYRLFDDATSLGWAPPLAIDDGELGVAIGMECFWLTDCFYVQPFVDVADGEWHHVVFTSEPGSPTQFTGSTPRLWVDGVKFDGFDDMPLDAWFSGFRNHVPSTLTFNGEVAELALYDRLLTSAEVSAHALFGGITTTAAPVEQAHGRGAGTGESGDPVNVATGNFFDTWVDVPATFGPGALSVARTYNSTSTLTGVLGVGWQTSFEASMTEELSGDWTYVNGEGRELVFADDGVGGFLRPAEMRADLVVRVDGSAALEYDDGSVVEFDLDGRLEEATGWDGTDVAYTWTAGELVEMTSSLGDSIEFTYVSGRLAEAEHSDGRTVTYGFDVNDNLSSVTDVVGEVTLFNADTAGLVTSIVDPTGVTIVDSVYDGARRVISQVSAGEAEEEFVYDDATMSTTVTNTETNESIVYLWDADHRLVGVLDAAGNLSARGYDPAGTPVWSMDRAGAETMIDTDVAGYPTEVVRDGAPRSTITYDTENRVETIVVDDGDNNVIDEIVYTYTGSDRLPTTRTTYAGTTEFDITDSLIESVTDPDGIETTYTYTADRQVETITNGDGETITYTYDTAGRVATITSELGAEHEFTYNDAGQVLTETAPDGGVTTYTYDDAGRVLTVEDPEGGVTSYDYDIHGRLETVTDANLNDTTYTYDTAGRVATVTDAEAGDTTYTYTVLNRVATVTDPAGRTTAYSYDDAGRTVAVENHADEITSYAYDTAGHRVATTDPLGRTTTTGYDDYGRVAEVHHPDGTSASYVYDADGRLSETWDQRSGVTTTTYTDAGRIATITDPAGVITAYTYDLAGRVATTTTGGHTTTYAYDDDGRTTSVTSPTGSVSTYTYDDASRVLTTTDPAGVTTTNTYDLNGRVLTNQTEGQGTITNVYDPAGNMSSVTDALGNTTSWVYDGNHRPTTRTNELTGVDAWTYYPDGAVQTSDTPDTGAPRTTTHTYDTAGRLATITDPTGRVTVYDHNEAGDLLEQVHSLDGLDTITHTFDYDTTTGRLVSAADPNGTTQYTYDGDTGDLTMIERDTSGDDVIVGVGTVSFVDATSATNGTGDDEIIVDQPAGVAEGDLLLAAVAVPAQFVPVEPEDYPADDFTGTDTDPWHARWDTSLSGSGTIEIDTNRGLISLDALTTTATATMLPGAKYAQETQATFSLGSLPGAEISFWLVGNGTWSTTNPERLTDGARLAFDTDTDTIRLETITGDGTPEVRDTDTLTLAASTDYRIRARITDTAFTAKVWEATDPEPTSWTLAATPGGASLYGTGAISVDVRDGSALDVYIDDYSAFPIDTDSDFTVDFFANAEWDPTLWSTSTLGSAQFDADPFLGHIEIPTGTGTARALGPTALATTDGLFGFDFQPSDVADTELAMWIRGSGTWSTTYPERMTAGYRVVADFDADTVRLESIVADGTPTVLDSTTVVFEPDTTYGFGLTAVDQAIGVNIIDYDTWSEVSLGTFNSDHTTGRSGLVVAADGNDPVAVDATVAGWSDVTIEVDDSTGYFGQPAGLLTYDGWEFHDVAESDAVNVTVLSRIATSTEPADWTFELDSTTKAAASIVAYTNVDTTANNGIVDIVTNVVEATSHDIEAVTTEHPEQPVIAFAAAATDTTYTPASGFTERTDIATPAGDAVTLAVADRNPTVAHTPTTGTFTPATGADGATVTVTVQPPVGNVTLRTARTTTIEYDYDQAGRRTSIIHPDGTHLTYTYNTTTGWLDQIEDADTLDTIEFDYDDDGRLVTETTATSLREWTWDDDQLIEYTQDLDGTTNDHTTTLTYDTSGRVATETTGTITTTYTYDQAGQLIAATNGTDTWTWAYDELARVTNSTGPDGTLDYTYDNANQLTAVDCTSGPCTNSTHTYDLAGRRTTSTLTGLDTTYTYDAAGRLVTTELDNGTDPTIVNRSYTHDNHLLNVTSYNTTTATMNEYTWDPSWTLIDHTIDATTTLNQITATITSDTLNDLTPNSATWNGDQTPQTTPYGTPNTTWTTRPGYRGELHTPDGLIHLRNRNYDPTTTQFLTHDPLPGVPGTTTLTNPYHYANNNPLMYADPYGLMATDASIDGQMSVHGPIGELTPSFNLNSDVPVCHGAALRSGPCIPAQNALEEGLLTPLVPRDTGPGGFYEVFNVSGQRGVPIDSETYGYSWVDEFFGSNSDWMPVGLVAFNEAQVFLVNEAMISVSALDRDDGSLFDGRSGSTVMDLLVVIETSTFAPYWSVGPTAAPGSMPDPTNGGNILGMFGDPQFAGATLYPIGTTSDWTASSSPVLSTPVWLTLDPLREYLR